MNKKEPQYMVCRSCQYDFFLQCHECKRWGCGECEWNDVGTCLEPKPCRDCELKAAGVKAKKTK